MSRRVLLLALLAACARPALDGPDGRPGSACAFRRDGATLLVSCEDGSLATVAVGAKGDDSLSLPGEKGADFTSPTPFEVEKLELPPGACQGPGFLLRVTGGDGQVVSERAVCRPAPPCDVVFGNVTLTDPLRVLAFASAGCRELRGLLDVRQVGGMRELPAFARARWTAAALRIRDNANLRSLASLNGLAGPLASLEITGNPVLTSLVGLENVTEVRGPFRITGNRSLLLCEAERLRDSIGTDRIRGPIEIEGLQGDPEQCR